MNKLVNGLLAGLVATIVLSALMVIKAKLGLMPDLNVIAMLAHHLGGSPVMGWVAHFTIGVVGYGLVYALFFSEISFGGPTVRGMVLGVAGWLVMMLVVMPMVGAGLFGLGMPSGVMVPVATLILHLIFGAVLGITFARLTHAVTVAQH